MLALAILLSGCATYKFQRGEKPYEKGYVVSRAGYIILEYTIGKDNNVAQDISTAKKRFYRRRSIVEYYYKRMGEIENRFKEAVVDPPLSVLKFIGGIFRLPWIAVSDYRYEHNSKYREMIKKREQQQDENEAARITKLKEYLNNYIQRDLALERPAIVLPALQAPAVKQEEASAAKELPVTVVQKQPPVSGVPAGKPLAQKVEPLLPPQEIPTRVTPPQPITQPLSSVVEESEGIAAQAERNQKITQALQEAAPLEKKKKEQTRAVSHPKAVIIAKPTQGYSPLKVHFYGSQSHSSIGKIASYLWDFGDGDTSTKPNPLNTYYSGSFEPVHFTATLTVSDSKGNTATTSATIEVLNK